MVQKTYRFLFLLLSFNLTLALNADTWKVLFYMDSTDGLSDMAIKNITDMVRGKPEDTVDFVVQLHAYYKAGLRYKVTSKGLSFIEEVTLSDDCRQNLGDAADWAFTNTTADHTMLILSDHGWGVLEPIWNEDAQEWQVGTSGLNNACSTKRCPYDTCMHHKQNHKGFMFMVEPRTYLANQDLVDLIAYIKTMLLHKKISIVAFDTCMGDMFEIGYQLAPYADYLVGSQSCSLTDGFAYQGIIEALNKGLNPREMAKSMVQTFDAYYAGHDTSGIYTHAALDLSVIKKANRSLNNLIAKLLQRPDCKLIFSNAAKLAPYFCLWPMYTDLIAYCKHLEEQLDNEKPSADKERVQKLFAEFYQSMEQVIVARCGGSSTQGLAHGVAIYLPTDALADSYYETLFAHESQWINLLETLHKPL